MSKYIYTQKKSIETHRKIEISMSQSNIPHTLIVPTHREALIIIYITVNYYKWMGKASIKLSSLVIHSKDESKY